MIEDKNLFTYCFRKKGTNGRREQIRITGGDCGGRLWIPAQIDGYPVTEIGRKAFLGNRSLCQVIMPDSVEAVGDWAFQGCVKLEEVRFSRRGVFLGNGVFRKCGSLRYIVLPDAPQSLARLLAMAASELSAAYLLDLPQAGSPDWYARLDRRIWDVLAEPEETALRDLVYCAEEDMMAKQEACLRGRRETKIRIALLRLSYGEGLSAEKSGLLAAYLRRAAREDQGCGIWESVAKSGKERFLFCDCLLAGGVIDGENLDDALHVFGTYGPELKAYLLQAWQKRREPSFFWEKLDLDKEEVII